MKSIVLMGFMGAGKTTLGKALAKDTKILFQDTDELIEKEQGKKISEIFAEEGEQAFREMETRLLESLQGQQKSRILSIGGGMPLKQENRELLRKLGVVVYLKASKETILERVSKNQNRPLLAGEDLEEKVSRLMEEREKIYLETAHQVMDTDGKQITQILWELKEILK